MKLKDSEIKVKEYIKSLSEGTGKVNISLAQISDDIDLSVATVHRAIRKLEDYEIIQVQRSQAKNKPDTIMFLGDPDDIFPMADELIERASSVFELSRDLVRKLMAKQRELEELKRKLEDLESKKINETVMTDGVRVVFYRDDTK